VSTLPAGIQDLKEPKYKFIVQKSVQAMCSGIDNNYLFFWQPRKCILFRMDRMPELEKHILNVCEWFKDHVDRRDPIGRYPGKMKRDTLELVEWAVNHNMSVVATREMEPDQ
jgi:hypothetical protein